MLKLNESRKLCRVILTLLSCSKHQTRLTLNALWECQISPTTTRATTKGIYRSMLTSWRTNNFCWWAYCDDEQFSFCKTAIFSLSLFPHPQLRTDSRNSWRQRSFHAEYGVLESFNESRCIVQAADLPRRRPQFGGGEKASVSIHDALLRGMLQETGWVSHVLFIENTVHRLLSMFRFIFHRFRWRWKLAWETADRRNNQTRSSRRDIDVAKIYDWNNLATQFFGCENMKTMNIKKMASESHSPHCAWKSR